MWTWLDTGGGSPRGLRAPFNLPGDGKWTWPFWKGRSRGMAVTRPWGCAPVEDDPRGGDPRDLPLDIYPWTSLPPGRSPGGHVPGDERLTYPAMGYFTYPAMTPCYPVMTALPTRRWKMDLAVLEGPFPGDGCYPAMGMCPRGGSSPGRGPPGSTPGHLCPRGIPRGSRTR